MNEKERIIKEYKRRRREIPEDRYAIWNPSALHTRFSREKTAIELLYEKNVFPNNESKCCEVGYGSLGWLGTLISWGVREENLYGIELDEERAVKARAILPKANLFVGDASNMPFENDFFDLILASTLFTSILEKKMRSDIASEIKRVLKKGGVFLYYDFAFDNPHNPNVKGLKKSDVLKLFPEMKGFLKRTTLAPPISRMVAPVSFLLASFLESFPFLRTHLIGVFIKE